MDVLDGIVIEVNNQEGKFKIRQVGTLSVFSCYFHNYRKVRIVGTAVTFGTKRAGKAGRPEVGYLVKFLPDRVDSGRAFRASLKSEWERAEEGVHILCES